MAYTAFKPQQTGPFARKTAGGGAKAPFNPKSMDHLVTVSKIDGKKGTIFGKNHLGKIAKYFIDPAVIARSSGKFGGASTIKFIGYLINDDMAEEAPSGHKVVLERAKWVFKEKQEDGTTVDVYQATWVFNSSSQTDDKLFPALVTANSSKRAEDRLTLAQIWDEKSVASTDAAGIKEYSAKLDAVVTAFASDKYTPKIGFQLRALKPKETFNGPGYECFDSSLPYDSEAISSDESTEKTYRPISGAMFQEIVSGYESHIKSAFSNVEGLVIDVITYRIFPASTMSKYMTLGFEFSPKRKMCSRKAKISIGDEVSYIGKNVAVRGIVELTDDKYDKKTKTETIRNIIQKLHVNNTMYDVRSAIQSPDGKRVEMNEAIKVAIIEKAPGEEQSGPRSLHQVLTNGVKQDMEKIRKEVLDEMDSWEEDPFGIN